MIDDTSLLNNNGMFEETENLQSNDPNFDIDTSNLKENFPLSIPESINSDPMYQQIALTENSPVMDNTSIIADGQISEFTKTDSLETIESQKNCSSVKETMPFGSLQNEEVAQACINTPLTNIENPSIDVDNLTNIPRAESLEVSNEDINQLQKRVEGLERSEHRGEISFGKKMCPTRHGCQGATDCDYSYGGYPE